MSKSMIMYADIDALHPMMTTVINGLPDRMKDGQGRRLPMSGDSWHVQDVGPVPSVPGLRAAAKSPIVGMPWGRPQLPAFQRCAYSVTSRRRDTPTDNKGCEA